ncbi:MAG: ANTAR domain-containing protein [Mycobacterium sp.]|nr:ANTAR domain-containing protein [Mycobacterium sp.]
MPAPSFHPRDETAESPAPAELFDRILERIQRDLPGAVGLAVSVHGQHREFPGVLAARGVGREFVAAQLGGLGGPVADAVEHQVPVLSPELGSDDRWPTLTPASLRESQPGPGENWLRARGAAAIPGVWHGDETVVLCCLLSEPAGADTITTLAGYEQLVAAAMMTAAAQDTTQIADMLAVLQSRGAIEQAKGVIMGLLRCDAGTAWATLRRASHESNIKLRALSVALVEHIGGQPAEQPAVGAPIIPDAAARRAAALLWAVLTHTRRPS